MPVHQRDGALTYDPAVQFTADVDVFRSLPRHPDWNYEYLDGQAHLSYQPQPLQLIRDLSPVRPRVAGTQGLVVAAATNQDRDEAVDLVDAVWSQLDPYRIRWAHPGCSPIERPGARFTRTLAGSDDPWDPGMLVARAHGGAGPLVGLVTLNAWRRVDAPGLLAEPGLSWLTVDPHRRLAGVATALLAASVDVAVHTGAGELHSAVSCANIPSVCWHWVNGFRLLGHAP